MEGEWENTLKSALSVRPALDLLKGIERVDYTYRRIATTEEFYFHLQKAKSFSALKIMYLAFHGTKEGLWFANGHTETLEQLSEKAKSVFEQRIVFFGACYLGKNQEMLSEFKNVTGAKLVVGYSNSIDFFESMILDLALMRMFLHYKRGIKDRILKEQKFLVQKTGLIIV